MKKFLLVAMICLSCIIVFQDKAFAKNISDKKIQKIVNGMTLDEKIGQLYMSPSSGDANKMANDIKKYNLGGIVLFGEDFSNQNVDSMKQKDVKFQDASKYGLFIATDQEGGTVSRLSTSPQLTNGRSFPSPQEVYKQSGMNGVIKEYSNVAKTLRRLGINWNFAPVADVSNDSNSFIYDRTLGQNYKLTARYVSKVVPAIQKQQVAATLKHFPGYGSSGDTHTGFASDERSAAEVKKNDFLPFKAGIKAKTDSVLVGHVVVNNFDASKPASVSKPVHEILRKELKFKGVIITDDMGMGALTNFAQKQNTNIDVMAIEAGNDMLLSNGYVDGIPAIKDAIKRGDISQKQIDNSVRRILELKAKLNILK
ncbi:Beta-hexosaminidase [Ligilactobacillus salivarius]|uniref:glycoside hydrolase family 3 N-terminal domain-containing protein n=1 Tax=Ligilactobacillus salivarius TaxID=1624 RepID=UPI000DE8D529|nr:glycoside hydrolase family 3 N-terminal domain-containing protein [Ligilactobacillus salivarius]AYC10756.1 Beta-hexosaminidase [Ligilactobacillus salivarius]MBE5066930.1 beta-N-acetylhexosaminidase [Ligilactobacillus salivarius]QIG37178.1 Beta-hexosaminidase [Ligilactobacillus salivarius]